MAEYDLQSVSDLQNSNGGLNMKRISKYWRPSRNKKAIKRDKNIFYSFVNYNLVHENQFGFYSFQSICVK